MIKKSILKEVLVSNEEFILKEIKRIVKREGIVFPKKLKKVGVFYGVRRSGKTFILFDLFKQYQENALYLDFEDDRLVGFELKDFEILKEAFLELKPNLIGKEVILLLDELQNIKGWERFCRRAVEREKMKVFVSGSSSNVIPSKIQTELRGRSWTFEILPFSFREFLVLKDVNPNDKNLFYGQKGLLIKKYIQEYLKWGGFPEVCLSDSDFEKRKLIKEYLQAIYFRDLVEKYNITNLPLLEALEDKLFSSFSLKFSLTSFYNHYKNRFPFSKDLLFRYYKNFLDSLLVFEVKKFTESTYKRMRNPAKIYLVDIALSKRVSSLDKGRLLENIVFLELRRRGYKIFYFEEKRECDFIIKTDEGKLSPIQVCFETTKENKEREILGLVEAGKWIGAKSGLLITYNEEKEISSKGLKIKIIPVWKWLILRDKMKQ